MIELQKIANELALQLRLGIKALDLPLSLGPGAEFKVGEGRSQFRVLDPDEDARDYYECPTHFELRGKWEFDEYRDRIIKPLAGQFIARLNRHRPVKFYNLELPKGCDEVVRGECIEVSCRIVTDYNIRYDLNMTRYDVLVGQ